MIWSFLKKLFTRSEGAEPEAEWDFGSGRISETQTVREELDGPGGPITAREAFDLVHRLAHGYDREAKLYMLASAGKLDAQGRATNWEFKYQFPNRWARAVFSVATAAAPGTAQPGDEHLEVTIIPFPPPGSAMARMLMEGQEGFVKQQWQMELERKPSLPANFKDSAEAAAVWARDGLDLGSLGRSVRLEGMTLPLGGAVWRLTDPESGKKSLKETPFV